jgi:hypothetical protein
MHIGHLEFLAEAASIRWGRLADELGVTERTLNTYLREYRESQRSSHKTGRGAAGLQTGKAFQLPDAYKSHMRLNYAADILRPRIRELCERSFQICRSECVCAWVVCNDNSGEMFLVDHSVHEYFYKGEPAHGDMRYTNDYIARKLDEETMTTAAVYRKRPINKAGSDIAEFANRIHHTNFHDTLRDSIIHSCVKTPILFPIKPEAKCVIVLSHENRLKETENGWDVHKTLEPASGRDLTDCRPLYDEREIRRLNESALVYFREELKDIYVAFGFLPEQGMLDEKLLDDLSGKC